MMTHDFADDLMRELQALRDRLPQVVDEVRRLSASGEGAGGSIRATAAASGEITRVDIDTRFLRIARPGEVDNAILAALRRAQTAAAELEAAHLEQLRFLDFPIGEVLSGNRELSDLPPPPDPEG